MTLVRFTSVDVDRAYDTWRCSCGPAAFAAILGLMLDEARPHFGPDFPGYTNPTRMFAALRSAGAKFDVLQRRFRCAPPLPPLPWPRYGLARIQWEGPWTKPGVPIAAQYRHTHWVGVSQGTGSRGQHLVDIWDVNCLGECPAVNLIDNDGWIPLQFWSADIVPLLTADIPRATGGWHVTHAIEVQR